MGEMSKLINHVRVNTVFDRVLRGLGN